MQTNGRYETASLYLNSASTQPYQFLPHHRALNVYYNADDDISSNIKPVESLLVSVLASGEGWHNYHHTFPWDYRASEFGTKVNVTTHIIDMLAYLGLVYDLRTASKQMVQQRIERTGDGTKTK
ncbi:Desaturase 1 [Carabus blaptoides fortunei]